MALPAYCWRCVFGNKDLRVEIMAAFLLVVTGGLTGLGAFMLAMRSANLEQRRHEYELVRDRREAMKEFAREIPRQQVMLRQIAKRNMWLKSIELWPPAEGDRATYWQGNMLPDEVALDNRRLLDEWTASEGYTAVCWHARAYFGAAERGPGMDKIESAIQRLDDFLGRIATLQWTSHESFDELCNEVIAEIDRAIEGGVVSAQEEALLLEAKLKGERARNWRGWFTYRHGGGEPVEGEPVETVEERRQLAIVNLVDAYDKLASALYERALVLMSEKIRLGEQE